MNNKETSSSKKEKNKSVSR